MKSEIARIRENIEQELIAMRQGLSGLAAGTARHAFIEAKMRQLSTSQDQLAIYVGKDEAVLFSCTTYSKVMEGKVE